MSEPTDPRIEMIETLIKASGKLPRKMFQDEAIQLYRLEQARKEGTEDGNALAAVYEEARLLAMDEAQKKSLSRDGHFSVSS